MHLKLEELRRIAKRTIDQEQKHTSLREELFRVYGAPVMVSANFEKVFEAANEHIDLLESTGRDTCRGDFKLSVLLGATDSTSPAARKIAARLLPERFASRLTSDRSTEVRCAAARRLDYSLVKEAVKKYPNDDQLRTIARQKRLEEAGLPKPKEVDEPFDLYGEEPLGQAVKQKPGDDLSDSWYERLAKKLCSQYGNNLEGQWEEALATRYVASHYSTTGVMLDREKLLKCVYDCIKEREDAVIGEGSLRALSARLLRESCLEEEVAMPVIEEKTDPAASLLDASHSSTSYVNEAERVFSVRKSTIPAGVKKYRIGESRMSAESVPVNGKIPGGKLTSRLETALDRYVESWNKQQALRGEPYRISWGPHPLGVDMIGFNVELK